MGNHRPETNRRTFIESVGALGVGVLSIGSDQDAIPIDPATLAGPDLDATESVVQPRVVIGVDGVTLDGQGRTITGPEEFGTTAVLVTGDDVTVKNLVLEGFEYGVHYRGTAGGTITDVTASGYDNDSGQVYLEDATGTTVVDCDLRDPLYSVRLSNVDDVTIRNNLLAHRGGDGVGVRGDDVTNSLIADNDLDDSDVGIRLVEADNNEVLRNFTDFSVEPLTMIGNGNLVAGNSARSETGITVRGDDNRIVRNRICARIGKQGDEAVDVSGNGNVVEDNTGCELSGTIEIVAADGVPAFEYRFVADGVEFGPQTEDNDSFVQNDDGSVTVLGRVGNGFADDYRVKGLRSFAANTTVRDFRVLQDGNDVTTELTGSERRLEVISVGNEERFSYEARLLGAAEKITDAANLSADLNDEIVVTRDGVVLRGVVGGGYGDSYRIWTGTPSVDFQATTGSENYEVVVR